MTDVAAAYARVLAEPWSVTARERLAAAWRDAGDPQAELVEVQLRYRQHRLAGTVWSDEANELLRSSKKLVRIHGARWASAVAPHVEGYAFHRGCVAEVTLRGAAFASVMPTLVALAPIQHVNLTAPLDLASVLASPLLEAVTSLSIRELGPALGDAEAVQLAASPHVRNLRWLRLTDNVIADAGVEALAASAHLAACQYLDLRGNLVDPTPAVKDDTGMPAATRPVRAEQLERAHGPRPWLALPDMNRPWPPDRDDVATSA
jgi:hypothetical protein